MLEILALIFLTRNMGALAVKKGLKSGTWKLYTVLAWFAGEIIGVVLGLLLFEGSGILGAIVLGLGCAIASYAILRNSLSKRPDAMDEDINRIGVRDLYP